MNHEYIYIGNADGEKLLNDFRKQLEGAEIENNNLHKKIAELEDKCLMLEANQLYNTLCMQGKYDDARIVWELITRL